MQIAVVGAGIAGIAAARDLANAGHDVVVLEARHRIGGRIHTSRAWRDVPVDLGASWIHGTSGNPISELASRAGIPTVATDYDKAQLHVDPALGLEGAGEEWCDDFVTRALAAASSRDRDISLRAAIDAQLAKTNPDETRRTQLEFYLSANYEQEFSGSLSSMSAWNIEDSDQFEGPDVLFPRGYDEIPMFLAQGLNVLQGSVVRKIEWGSEKVRLTLADGDIREVDKVVVTVPLGVLKADAIEFSPALPDAKQQAIARLGMGLLNKHWLRFATAQWPESFDWHEWLSAEQTGRWSQWVSVARTTGAPALLVFSAADAALEIEALPDADIEALAMAVVRSMFGNAVADPIGMQATRWQADPFARGSYSFHAVGSGRADRAELAKPVDDMLYFAGEAASPDYPGTVHGALLSGQEAARLALAST